MITLYGFGPMFGLPDPSPFVLKTEIQLKLAELPFGKARCRPMDAPKGKLPYIDDDGEVVADSTFIRDHIEKKYGIDLDRGLTRDMRARAWAIERMLEDHLYWAVVHLRWADERNFAKGPSHFFDTLAPDVREATREAAAQARTGNAPRARAWSSRPGGNRGAGAALCSRSVGTVRQQALPARPRTMRCGCDRVCHDRFAADSVV